MEEDDYANNNAGEAVYANALDAKKPYIGESPGRPIVEERNLGIQEEPLLFI